ncbi:hypothetical protein F2Q69_00046086 [Brassica cretica]|uniref:Uncharacterized protein n=1 Tax=Brassica cretica TaxID=69181 RepID=A0A8S9PR05_BRACR|nr:hypothetical protein F2Q69_00046086 [Brassica cretica]
MLGVLGENGLEVIRRAGLEPSWSPRGDLGMHDPVAGGDLSSRCAGRRGRPDLALRWSPGVPCDPTPSAGTGVPLVPDALAQPSGSSTTPGPVAEKEQTVKTMPPPPVKRAIVLALFAPSATPAAPPKGRKRSCSTSEMTKKKRCIKSEEGETSLRGGTGLMSQHRAKICSSIFLYD